MLENVRNIAVLKDFRLASPPRLVKAPRSPSAACVDIYLNSVEGVRPQSTWCRHRLSDRTCAPDVKFPTLYLQVPSGDGFNSDLNFT